MDVPPTSGQAALAEAARLETARVYGQLCRESTIDRDAARIAEWEAWRATQPRTAQRRLRVVAEIPALNDRIEQRIARDHPDERIARELGTPVQTVQAVRAHMNAISA